MYDRMLAGTERAGLSGMRADLLREASGETLEIGAGTGLNLDHYPAAVTALTATEPDPHMAKRLRSRAASEERPTTVVEAPAEELPFDDDSFDTVVATLVFCTVDDPDRAAAEVARVLRPQGRMLLLEHVRDPDEGRLAKWQDRLERPWGWVGAGCHPNRDTAATLARAGLELDLAPAELPKAPPIVRPMIRGAGRTTA
jgi:ubiquinone/menaquinone biosynthesis C-methylase UbiE